MPDSCCAANGNDGNALSVEIPADPPGQRFNRHLIAVSLDEYHGLRSGAGGPRFS